MIDTHFHLNVSEFDSDRDAVVSRAAAAGIQACVVPGISPLTWPSQQIICRRYAGFCFPGIGLHPEDVDARYETTLAQTEAQFEQAASAGLQVVAVGEIGIDGYWSREYIDRQIIVFETQLEWAAARRLPVIIHVRNTFPEILSSLKKKAHLGLEGVFHAYSGSLETFLEANRYAHLKMGIGGVLTYKKSHLPAVVARIPLSEIVTETDAPWLTPVPFRGHRNETAYMRYTLETLATIKGISLEEADAVTTANAISLFHLNPLS